MNITFLIGNGFDRALGLKTSYTHFYKKYCKLVSGVEIIDKFRKEIDNNIKSETEQAEKLWSDAELGLAKVTSEYSIQDFVVCCEDIHERLTEYLGEQDEKFTETDDHFPEIVQLFASHLLSFQQDLTPAEQKIFSEIRDNDKINNSTVNIITLNYTTACDKIYKVLSKKPLSSWNTSNGARTIKMGQLIHAHGYVDNYPILGVCNPKLIENVEYLDDPAFRALMIKKESIDAVGQTWREDTFSVINKSNIICIFGVSLGESDSDYWEQIAQWLKTADNRHLIIFKFDSNLKSTRISYYQQFVKKQEVQNKFLKYSDYDSDICKKLCERIHVVINAPHMFVLPDELKVRYPTPAKKSSSYLTVLEALEKQQELESLLTQTEISAAQISQPLGNDILTQIEQSLTI